MKKRENSFVEAMKFIRERNNMLAEKDEQKINERVQNHAKFLDEYYKIRQSRLDEQVQRNKIIEGVRNSELSTAIKAIYITALEAETLTDNGILLAEELVDNWIAEEGGASKIIRECKNKTYLLNRICNIVEEAALEDMKIIFEKDDEDDVTKSEDDVDYDMEEDEEEEDDDKEEDDDSDEEEDDDEELDYEDVDAKDDADQIDDDENEPDVEDEVEKQMDEDLPEEDTSNDIEGDETEEISDEEVDDEDIDDDGEADIEVEPEDYDNKVLEDLDKEEDVQKAVALIRQRVADAEEIFIKNNAKDKEQINALLGKISDNIKTVEDMADKDKEAGKDAVAQENVRMARRSIDNITNNRPLSIMEMFARQLNRDIMRDEHLRENYIEEDGSLDTDTIVESAKILYGFLETLNTLQIKTVDSKYIESIFS
jgi:hypothetical protein